MEKNWLKIIRFVVIVGLMALMVLINTTSIDDKQQAQHIVLKNLPFRSFGLYQKWNLFAPNPTKINPYVLIIGKNYHNQNINLRTHEISTQNDLMYVPEKPKKGNNHLSYNLSFLGTYLAFDKYRAFGEQYCKNRAEYEAKKWYMAGGEQLKSVHFVQVAVETKRPGVYAPPKVNELFAVQLSN